MASRKSVLTKAGASTPVGTDATSDVDSEDRPTFSVDTHLFRELGELLVGRDSTALIELIKNAYDADAREVIVYGEALHDTDRGYIAIRDNGTGMSRGEFEVGFLRIASRGKDTGEKRSPVLQRRFTGAKGVGRLAANKLARLVEISSLRWTGDSLTPPLLAKAGVDAIIDWEKIEEHETLDEVRGTDAIIVRATKPPHPVAPGTTITLRRLRNPWSKASHNRFLEEVQTFAAPPVLIGAIPRDIVEGKMLFATPTTRDARAKSGESFKVSLEGELAPSDDFGIASIEAASWVLEISAESSTVKYAVAPTRKTLIDLPDARSRTFEIPHPSARQGPFFQARVLLRTGRAWSTAQAGIRVFVEGFRILPYGEVRNDWLSLDRDVAERRRGRFALEGEEDPFAELLSPNTGDRDEGLLILPNKHYFGAVFLTQDSAGALRPLVNREGFVPDSAYETLVTLVRGGVDLLTRTRASASEGARKTQRRKRAKKIDTEPLSGRLRRTIGEAHVAASELRKIISAGDTAGAAKGLDVLSRLFAEVDEASSEVIAEIGMIRVLASVGTQMAAFVHEINNLVGTAEAVDHSLRRLRTARKGGAKSAAEQTELLRALTTVVGDLRKNLERQASYLIDVVTPDARRRRARQPLAERLDSAVRLVAGAAELRGIRIENGIPSTIQTVPMFAAEVTTVFANLLTNAVKAAGEGGRVRATCKRHAGRLELRIENTGVRVDVKNSERWFEPFESTTSRVDAALGQGMGLGLSITRNMLAEYGGSIAFVDPSDGFETAIALDLPT